MDVSNFRLDISLSGLSIVRLTVDRRGNVMWLLNVARCGIHGLLRHVARGDVVRLLVGLLVMGLPVVCLLGHSILVWHVDVAVFC